ncbi:MULTISPECIES: hypothetical protein [Xanthomonas]|uniref:hypothetical protein n=1 Tax=Xanthomonas TaxID=338 RepID=UPI0013C375E4|nr:MULTISPECIES: hypothetical protein [Xanthomonas]MBV6778304.1 hypothetical protein [Xanthomonas campestris pv. carissae]MCC5041741.1 hypothetical protein [Xanthomonas campestris]
MTASNKTFGLMSSRVAFKGEAFVERIAASTREVTGAAARRPLPIAAEWLNESELTAVKKAVGPVRLQITDSIFSKLG